MDNHTTDWGEGQSICAKDLSYFGALCREGILLDAEGELVPLDRQVIETVTSGELLSQQFPDLDANAENFSEKMAIFGGSWSFGLLFIGILIVLMMLNSLVLLATPFEPYPFIFVEFAFNEFGRAATTHHYDEPKTSRNKRPNKCRK